MQAGSLISPDPALQSGCTITCPPPTGHLTHFPTHTNLFYLCTSLQKSPSFQSEHSPLVLGIRHSPFCLVTHESLHAAPPVTSWTLGCWIQAPPLQPDSCSLIEKRDQNTPKGVGGQRYAILFSRRFKLDFCELLCQSVSCSVCLLLVPSVVPVGRCPPLPPSPPLCSVPSYSNVCL